MASLDPATAWMYADPVPSGSVVGDWWARRKREKARMSSTLDPIMAFSAPATAWMREKARTSSTWGLGGGDYIPGTYIPSPSRALRGIRDFFSQGEYDPTQDPTSSLNPSNPHYEGILTEPRIVYFPDGTRELILPQDWNRSHFNRKLDLDASGNLRPGAPAPKPFRTPKGLEGYTPPEAAGGASNKTSGSAAISKEGPGGSSQKPTDVPGFNQAMERFPALRGVADPQAAAANWNDNYQKLLASGMTEEQASAEMDARAEKAADRVSIRSTVEALRGKAYTDQELRQVEQELNNAYVAKWSRKALQSGRSGGAGPGKPSGPTLSDIASADPAQARTDGDRYAIQVAGALANVVEGAGVYGELPKRLQTQVDRATKALDGMRGGSLGGKRSGFEKDVLAPLVKDLQAYAQTAAAKQEAAGSAAKLRSTLANDAYRNWYYEQSLKLKQGELLAKAGEKKGAMDEAGTFKAITQLVDERDVDPESTLSRFREAVGLYGNDALNKGTFNNNEKMFIIYHNRLMDFNR